MIDEAIRKRNEPTNQPNKFFFFFWSDPRAVPHHSHIERREDGTSRPSSTPSTIPAVYASQLSCDMSLGTDINWVNGGWFSVIMSG